MKAQLTELINRLTKVEDKALLQEVIHLLEQKRLEHDDIIEKHGLIVVKNVELLTRVNKLLRLAKSVNEDYDKLFFEHEHLKEKLQNEIEANRE